MGKSYLSAALGLALVENSWRVLFARTSDLVQRLQVARRELALENAIAKLDRYDLLILDDIAYVTKDQAETSVLFELIAARYERRSMLITANQPFGEWSKIFPDQAMTLIVFKGFSSSTPIFNSFMLLHATNLTKEEGLNCLLHAPATTNLHTGSPSKTESFPYISTLSGAFGGTS